MDALEMRNGTYCLRRKMKLYNLYKVMWHMVVMEIPAGKGHDYPPRRARGYPAWQEDTFPRGNSATPPRGESFPPPLSTS
jgi:hypothetical protein